MYLTRELAVKDGDDPAGGGGQARRFPIWLRAEFSACGRIGARASYRQAHQPPQCIDRLRRVVPPRVRRAASAPCGCSESTAARSAVPAPVGRRIATPVGPMRPPRGDGRATHRHRACLRRLPMKVKVHTVRTQASWGPGQVRCFVTPRVIRRVTVTVAGS